MEDRDQPDAIGTPPKKTLTIKEAIKRLEEDVEEIRREEQHHAERELREIEDLTPDIGGIIEAFRKRLVHTLEREISLRVASMAYAEYEEEIDRGDEYCSGLDKAVKLITEAPLKVDPMHCKNCGHRLVREHGKIFHGQVFPSIGPYDYRCVCGCREPAESEW